jgi:hypothetical protein
MYNDIKKKLKHVDQNLLDMFFKDSELFSKKDLEVVKKKLFKLSAHDDKIIKLKENIKILSNQDRIDLEKKRAGLLFNTQIIEVIDLLILHEALIKHSKEKISKDISTLFEEKIISAIETLHNLKSLYDLIDGSSIDCYICKSPKNSHANHNSKKTDKVTKDVDLYEMYYPKIRDNLNRLKHDHELPSLSDEQLDSLANLIYTSDIKNFHNNEDVAIKVAKSYTDNIVKHKTPELFFLTEKDVVSRLLCQALFNSNEDNHNHKKK